MHKFEVFLRKHSKLVFLSAFFLLCLLYAMSRTVGSQASYEGSDFVLVSTIGDVNKYKVRRGDKFLSYLDTLRALESTDSRLVAGLKQVTGQHSAVFWECAPVTKATLASQEFEFVVIAAPSLARRTADISPFQDKFDEAADNADVLSFQNLGKDATLVVPCPPATGGVAHMTHLTSFMQTGNPLQINHLWSRVGGVVLSTIGGEANENRKFWLSTSGLGVSWLHVRLDVVPKYYNWDEYKRGR